MGAGRVLMETTVRIEATPAEVWALWLDFGARPRWHPRLEWARLDGAPTIGARGAWQPTGVRPVRVEITELEPERWLVLRGTHGPPVARGHYEHRVAPAARGGSVVTHRMRLTGPLAAPIGRLFGGPLGAFAAPAALDALSAALGAPRA